MTLREEFESDMGKGNDQSYIEWLEHLVECQRVITTTLDTEGLKKKMRGSSFENMLSGSQVVDLEEALELIDEFDQANTEGRRELLIAFENWRRLQGFFANATATFKIVDEYLESN